MAGAFWGALAIHELPEYETAAFNEDCNAMPRTLIGPKEPFYIGERQKLECFMNGIPSRLGRWRPIPELSGYRMPADNLYLCSACTHV